MARKPSELASPFGIRLPIEHDKASVSLAEQRQTSKNRLIQEAVKLMLSLDTAEPPAA